MPMGMCCARAFPAMRETRLVIAADQAFLSEEVTGDIRKLLALFVYLVVQPGHTSIVQCGDNGVENVSDMRCGFQQILADDWSSEVRWIEGKVIFQQEEIHRFNPTVGCERGNDIHIAVINSAIHQPGVETHNVTEFDSVGGLKAG